MFVDMLEMKDLGMFLVRIIRRGTRTRRDACRIFVVPAWDA